MKKILASIFLTGIFALPISTYAATPQSVLAQQQAILAQIESLTKIVLQLQAQLTNLQAEQEKAVKEKEDTERKEELKKEITDYTSQIDGINSEEKKAYYTYQDENDCVDDLRFGNKLCDMTEVEFKGNYLNTKPHHPFAIPADEEPPMYWWTPQNKIDYFTKKIKEDKEELAKLEG